MKYYNVYFDNSKKKIKRNFLIENRKIKKINIIIDYQVRSFEGLLLYCTCINSIIFKKFNRINITDMSHMFSGCKLLKVLNLSNFNTDSITDISYMLYGCSSLEQLNINNIKIINMNDMFYKCSDN